MLILLEGVDGAGKTTLAKALGGEYEHHGPPSKEPLEEYEDLLQYHRAGVGLRVIDRLHWGEMVYGPLYRGASRLSWAGFLHVEMLLQARGALRVHVAAPLEVCIERLLERGETGPTLDLLPVATRGFWLTFDRAVQPKTTTYGGSVRDLAQQLLHHAKGCDRAAEGLPLEYLGAPRPSYLLVGDRRSDPDGWCLVPFAPLPGGCGAWLLDALPGEWLGRIGIINAREVHDVDGLWRAIGRPRVIALGNEAARALGVAKVPCGRVPHPQYGRRFMHFERAAYTEALRAAGTGEVVRAEEITPWR